MKGVKLVSVVGMLILNGVGLVGGAGSSVDDHLAPVEKPTMHKAQNLRIGNFGSRSC